MKVKDINACRLYFIALKAMSQYKNRARPGTWKTARIMLTEMIRVPPRPNCIFRVSESPLLPMLNDFVSLANDIRLKKYDEYAGNEKELKEALEDFQHRYNYEIRAAHEIMLEDWFLLVHMFFQKNLDIKEAKRAAVQGFERLILDAIYNNGKIQNLHKKMNKKVRKFFSSFVNVFSLNYDNNIEDLTHRTVYHLHGDFSVLANSESSSNVQGHIRQKKGETVWLPQMKHCFCNALFNYSGRLKYKTATDAHALIVDSETYADRYMHDKNFREGVERLKTENPVYYELIMTKIQHPELSMASEYYFDRFENIQGELSIIGMSPNNDDYIFRLILNNSDLTKVTFYYYNEKESILKITSQRICLNTKVLMNFGKLWIAKNRNINAIIIFRISQKI